MKRILIQMPGRPVRVLAVLFAAILAAAPGLARPACAQDGQGRQAMAPDARDAATLPVAPDAALAQRLFGLETLPVLRRIEGAVPGWEVSTGAGVVGHIASTWEIAASVGYSGRPLDVLVAVDTRGRMTSRS